jgi:23S rRNA pseudouridine2605 synthase
MTLRPAAKSMTAGDASDGERIAKVMARAGACSRRTAEAWIAAGRVSVDGQIIETPACKVTAKQQIAIDGEPLKAPERARMWRYHKPAGLVTTHRDPQGRPTVFDRLAEKLPRVISVGRLDLTSEGLLLLTNDGALARHLELPSTGWMRRYRVRAYGSVTPESLDALASGITVEGVAYGPIQARIERVQGSNLWLAVALAEGRNREIRRVLSHIGLRVNRLIRMSYGPFQLGDLPSGEVAEISTKVLREQLGGDWVPSRRARGAYVERPQAPAASERPAVPAAGKRVKPARRPHRDKPFGKTPGTARPGGARSGGKRPHGKGDGRAGGSQGRPAKQ